MQTPITIAALAATAGLASAQTVNINILIDEPLLAPGDSTALTLEASFTTSDYGVAGILTDLVADTTADISGAWSDWALVSPMNGPGTTPGVPDGSGGFEGIIAGQLHFPPAGIYGFPQNPILFWTATFTAPADAAGSRVDLSTRTSRFEVYPDRASVRSESRLDVLVEGAGQIHVVPAPATGAALGLGLLALRRRRR